MMYPVLSIYRSEPVQTSRDGKTLTEIQQLEARLDRMMLVSEALWSLLRDKLKATDEELLDRVTEIDMQDGKLDGKVRRQAMACPKCNRTISPRMPRCMYCGQAVMHNPFA